MIDNWEQNELDLTDQLNETYGSMASFTHMGGANSTTSDILVEPRDRRVAPFYMEAKQLPAQSGQFTVSYDKSTRQFGVSKRSFGDAANAQPIIDCLNAYSEYYIANASNVEISLPKQTSFDWIKQHYANKGARFLITDDSTIVPIDQIDKFFDVKCIMRAKLSGSLPLPKKWFDSVVAYLATEYGIPMGRFLVSTDGKPRLFIEGLDAYADAKTVFSVDGTQFIFSRSKDDPELWEVRRRGTMGNPTIIFSEFKSNGRLTEADEKKFQRMFVDSLGF